MENLHDALGMHAKSEPAKNRTLNGTKSKIYDPDDTEQEGIEE